MQLSSLRFKLTLGVALFVAISIGVMTGVGWFSMSRNNDSATTALSKSMQQQAEQTLEDAAAGIAFETEALINRNFDLAKYFSAVLSATAHGSKQPPIAVSRCNKWLVSCSMPTVASVLCSVSLKPMVMTTQTPIFRWNNRIAQKPAVWKFTGCAKMVG